MCHYGNQQCSTLNHFDNAFSAVPIDLEGVLKTLKAGTIFMVKKSPEAAKQVCTSLRKGLFRQKTFCTLVLS